MGLDEPKGKKDKMSKEKLILVNYTGRNGGGPLDAYEITNSLLSYTPNVAAVVSEYVENLEMWKGLALKKLVVIPTYRNNREFITASLAFHKIKKKIRKELLEYEISYIYCPMVAMWSQKINRLFPSAHTYVVLHDPVPHSGDRVAPISKLLELFGFGISKKIYTDAEGIMVHSRRFLKYVEDKFHKKGKVFYLPLGRHDFYKKIHGSEPVIKYDPSRCNFLFFGSISYYKGIGILLDAYSEIEKKYDNVSLTIAGNGDFEIYKQSCSRLKNVTVINRWIKDSEVESLFRGGNIIAVVPYLDATQSGVVLVAMDYHVPVIATATGGLVEQVEDGVTGILVEPGNAEALERAMEELMNDEHKRKELVQNADNYLEEISWNKTAEKLLRIMGYEKA